MAESPGKLLRTRASQSTLQIPGAPNALLARLIERQGFPAIYLSGAAVSAGVLAMPDVGLITLPELVDQTRYITRAVDCPVIVDADTGFGEAVNVERTVVELESAGVAAIQLEDQVLPKKCGHLPGKQLVDPHAMHDKLCAAVAARKDPDLVIIARTDARGVIGFEEAVARAKLYMEAGADWVFPEALASPDEFAQFARQVPAPLLANMTEFGKSPLLDFEQLRGLGYAAVIYPVTLLRLAMKAAEEGLAKLAQDGTQASLLKQMQTRDELYDLLSYDAYSTATESSPSTGSSSEQDVNHE